MSSTTHTDPVVDRQGRFCDGVAATHPVSPSSVSTSIGVTLAVTVLSAAALSVHMIAANPGDWTAAALLDLARALGWIAFVLNTVFALSLVTAHAALERVWPRVFHGRRLAFLTAGLPALHVAWMLLNRLPMVQHLVHPPLFVTPTGLMQATAIGLVAALLMTAGMVSQRRPARAFVALTAAGVLAAGTLQWNAGEEVSFRAYSMERVRDAAASAGPAGVARPAPADGPVIVLGLDGWGWEVLVPLLEAGRMPHMAALIQQGAVGVLDNGDDSYSPRIWNTVFTGRPAEDHGVHDFVALRLPSSGRTLPNFVSQTPAIDSFYGLKQLLRRLPSLGLWELVKQDSTDVGVKSMWNIASDYGRRVVVANVLNTVPAQPVLGAMVSLDGDEGALGFYPPELAGKWVPHDTRPTRKRVLSAWEDALTKETDFTLALFREHEVDLGIYYTMAVDRLAHHHWDFYASDAWITTEVPAELTDAAWEALVAGNAGEPAFAAYGMIDAQLGRFRSAHPRATFVLVADHAWTFSGYQHYGSQDGIVLISGPRARAGTTIERARIEDILPTVLAMLGIPLANDLPGRILDDALAFASPIRTVETYGPKLEVPADEAMRVKAETLSHLEALGYLR